MPCVVKTISEFGFSKVCTSNCSFLPVKTYSNPRLLVRIGIAHEHPRHECIDSFNLVIWQSVERPCESDLGIDAINLGGLDEGIGDSSGLCATDRAGLSSNSIRRPSDNVMSTRCTETGPVKVGVETCISARAGRNSASRASSTSPATSADENRGSRTHLWIRLAFIEYRRATCATNTSAAASGHESRASRHPTKSALSASSCPPLSAK